MQYGSIGWSVGACLGCAVGSKPKGKRVLLFIGDGCFQIGAQVRRCALRSVPTPCLRLGKGSYLMPGTPDEKDRFWIYPALKSSRPPSHRPGISHMSLFKESSITRKSMRSTSTQCSYTWALDWLCSVMHRAWALSTALQSWSWSTWSVACVARLMTLSLCVLCEHTCSGTPSAGRSCRSCRA